MSVYNAVGEGPASPPQEVFVGEAGVRASFPAHYNLCVLLHKLVFIWVSSAFILNPGAFLFQLEQYRRFAALNCNAVQVVRERKNITIWLCFSCRPPTVPTAPPQNVAIQSATATQLDVTWDPPPVDAQNGDIQGYKVRLALA